MTQLFILLLAWLPVAYFTLRSVDEGIFSRPTPMNRLCVFLGLPALLGFGTFATLSGQDFDWSACLAGLWDYIVLGKAASR